MGLTSKERTARYRQRIYAEIDTLPKIECACGCRALIAPISRKLRPAQYVHGHNPGNESFRYKKGRIIPMKGCKTGEPSPNRGKKLPIDFSKNNNVLENLLLLCVSCHRQRHHEEQKSRKLVGHKSDMLSLYEGSLDAKKEVM